MADVFISYARSERADAERVKSQLEAVGLTVFLDVEGLDGGVVFSEVIDREVKSCGVILGLWSPTALTRPWVRTECDIGKRRGVLIPAAIRPFKELEVPAELWNIQIVDLTDVSERPDGPNWQNLMKALARALRRPDLLSQRPAQSVGDTVNRASTGSEAHDLRTPVATNAGARQPIVSLRNAGRKPIELFGLEYVLKDAGPTVWLSTDGSRVAGCKLDDVPIWSVSSGEILSTLSGHSKGVLDASFSRDGSRIATASLDGTARIWSVTSGENIAILGGHEQVDSVEYSSDSGLILTCSARDLVGCVWDATDYQQKVELSPVRFAGFSLDAKRVVSVEGHTASIWDASTGANKIKLLHGDTVWGPYFSPNRRQVATICEEVAHVWNLENGHCDLSLRHSSQVVRLNFSPDGKRIITVSRKKGAHVWDAAAGKELRLINDPDGEVHIATFSMDQSMIITASWSEAARVWDAETGQLRATLSGHRDNVVGLRLTPDGSRLITASNDQDARIWRLA